MKDKREKIIDTAIRLIIEEGINVPTAKIAKESGVSNGTLFNYFETKQNLIDTIFLSIKEEVYQCMPEDCCSNLELREFILNMWKKVFFWARENIEKHKACVIIKSSDALSKEALDKERDVFKCILVKTVEGIKNNKIINIPTDYIEELGAMHLTTAINYAAKHQLKDEELEKHINTSFEIFWKGISVK